MTRIAESHPKLFTKHMTLPEASNRIKNTHIGQAHIAGTGPSGTTCRSCRMWANLAIGGTVMEYKYSGDGTGDGDMLLQPSMCNKPIANKANKRVPHNAAACLFYDENKSPPPISRERKLKRTKG